MICTECTHALADWTARIRFVVALLLGKLAAHLECAVVDSLEDVFVELLRLLALERESHLDEGVCQALHADSDGAVAHVRLASLKWAKIREQHAKNLRW